MPAVGHFRVRSCQVEVAVRYGLRADIPRALRRHGPMTAIEIGNLMYWNRTPRNHRMGARWWINRSMKSSTRRAIAALKRAGMVADGGRLGRCKLYHFNGSRR